VEDSGGGVRKKVRKEERKKRRKEGGKKTARIRDKSKQMARLKLERWIIYGVGREAGPNPTGDLWSVRGQGRAEETSRRRGVRRPLYG